MIDELRGIAGQVLRFKKASHDFVENRVSSKKQPVSVFSSIHLLILAHRCSLCFRHDRTDHGQEADLFRQTYTGPFVSSDEAEAKVLVLVPDRFRVPVRAAHVPGVVVPAPATHAKRLDLRSNPKMVDERLLKQVHQANMG